MDPQPTPELHKCGLCGVTEAEHLELYSTPLGLLDFTFTPDKGPALKGHVRLCRPCTHEQLPRRLLQAAGVHEETLPPEVWT